jgi:hypothetical protein
VQKVRVAAIVLLVALAGAVLLGRGFLVKPPGEPSVSSSGVNRQSQQLCSAADSAGGVADSIVSGRDTDRYAVARAIYTAILAENPQDPCAATGLALLTVAEAEAARPDTWIGRWSQTWSGAMETWWQPLTDPLGTALGFAVLLVVVGWLLTPTIVRPRTVITTGERQASRFGAALLIAVVGAAPVLQVLTPQTPPDLRLLVAGLATVSAAAIAVSQIVLRQNLDGSPHDTRRQVIVAVGLLAMTLAAWVQAIRGSSGWWWLWWLGAGVVGVVWLAMSRGSRLAVNVTVRKDNEVSDDAAQLLLARLRQLGSEPPRGIRGAPQTDVTALPDDALTAVPGGAVAGSVFKLLTLVRPGVPWSFDVVLHGGGTVSWQIRRNGVPTDAGVTICTLADLGITASESDAAEQPPDPTTETAQMQVPVPPPRGVSRGVDDCLLTCAAAALLLTLSEAHPELRRGLCGAEKWETVATYTLAMTAPPTSSVRWDLLRRAELLEPKFGLAAFAAAYRPPIITLTQRLTFARKLDGLLAKFPIPVPPPLEPPTPKDQPLNAGWEALHLRLLHSVAAAWLNVALLTRAGGPEENSATFGSAWAGSAAAAMALVNRLTVTIRLEHLTAISTALRVPTYFLLADLANLRPWAPPQHDPPAKQVSQRYLELSRNESWRTPVNAVDHFARAAYLAANPGQTTFLDDLEIALSRPGLRDNLDSDPSFIGLLTAPPDPDPFAPVRDKFKQIVGGPPFESFLELPPFAPWSVKLQKSGLDQLEKLASKPPVMLATQLRVPLPTARRWSDLAKLAVKVLPESARNKPSDNLEMLALLINCGVTSTGALRMHIRQDPERLYTELVAAARRRPVVLTWRTTITPWKGALGIP